ncbi:hypothetical protein YYC_05578 [Plasmodium yoelii 17X]|uniref:Fam-c protein n=3 Tax=Plasmodium yoelii TaxID=5861 RepID=A0AAE9WUW1_PLAYO|nr:hypothetical protein YYC_05578 [Plasmodium yoelii 17X]WBY60475.1 fam-c protein [Plasmodium yoelii yoelii]
MNKRIFSLVCIALYTLLTVSIYCSEQKVSGVGSRIIRAIKKMNKRKGKNGIEFKSKTQLNNNNNKNPKDKDKKNKKSVYYQMSGRYGYLGCCC